ncbi:SUP35 [Symbiodinium microadriaticum]|nr:SUP35 [Symbiodinium microadriaticum]
MVEEMRRWLHGIEPCGGLDQYARNLAEAFNSPTEVQAMYLSTWHCALDAQFFEDFHIHDLRHQKMFRRWFEAQGTARPALDENSKWQEKTAPGHYPGRDATASRTWSGSWWDPGWTGNRWTWSAKDWEGARTWTCEGQSAVRQHWDTEDGRWLKPRPRPRSRSARSSLNSGRGSDEGPSTAPPQEDTKAQGPLAAWLCSLGMERYQATLEGFFDDPEQVFLAYTTPATMGEPHFDSGFFAEVGVTDEVHQRTFERWFVEKLHKARVPAVSTARASPGRLPEPVQPREGEKTRPSLEPEKSRSIGRRAPRRSQELLGRVQRPMPASQEAAWLRSAELVLDSNASSSDTPVVLQRPMAPQLEHVRQFEKQKQPHQPKQQQLKQQGQPNPRAYRQQKQPMHQQKQGVSGAMGAHPAYGHQNQPKDTSFQEPKLREQSPPLKEAAGLPDEPDAPARGAQHRPEPQVPQPPEVPQPPQPPPQPQPSLSEAQQANRIRESQERENQRQPKQPAQKVPGVSQEASTMSSREPGQTQEAKGDWASKLRAAREAAASLPERDARQHVVIAILGHTGAGKSTLFAALLRACGAWDQRSVEKFFKAPQQPGELLAERCSTPGRRFTLLDVPGRRSNVAQAWRALCQSDAAVLVVSAKAAELDSSIARGGQLLEHSLLAKCLGMSSLVIAVNKLGDASKAPWCSERFEAVKAKVAAALGEVGFTSDSLRFVPVCALHGTNVNLEDRLVCGACDGWYSEGSLLELLETCPVSVRRENADGGPQRVSVLGCEKQGNSSFVLCRVEAGDVEAGSVLQHAPSGQECGVLAIQAWGQDVRRAEPGDLARFKVLGALPTSGHVLSEDSLRCAAKFKAQIRLVETCRETPVMSQGFKCILHLHHSMEELCEVSKVIEAEDLRTNKKEAAPKVVRAPALALCVLQICSGREVPLEAGDGLLGQLSLRTDGGTIAVGSVAELPKLR